MATRRIALSEGRRPGWHWASHEIMDIYGAKLGPYGLAIYYALCRHANQNGESWPSHATLARETGMSVTSVKKAIKRLLGEEEGLEELKLIKKQTRQYESNGPRSNLYTLQEIPTLGRDTPQPGASHASDLGRDTATKKKQSKREPFKNNNVSEPSPTSSLSDKKKILRDFGLTGPIITQIANSHDMTWIQAAIMQMREPGGVVYLHREGWEPVLDEADTKTPIYCSECGDLEDICGCPEPKPRRVVHSELTTLQERRREDAVRSAANPDLDRLQRFSDVQKRFPDTPHELLEFEAGLKQR